MPEDFCQCGRELASERNKRLEKCRLCEKLEKVKTIENVSEFVAAQPIVSFEDGLTYVIETQPEYDD